MCHVSPFARAHTKIALARSAYLSPRPTRAEGHLFFLSRGRRNNCARARGREEKGFWVSGAREKVRALNGNCAGGCQKGDAAAAEREIRPRKQPFSRREFNLPPTVSEREKMYRARAHTCAGLFHLDSCGVTFAAGARLMEARIVTLACVQLLEVNFDRVGK